MKAVIDSAIPYIQGVLEPFAEVIYRSGNKFTPTDVSDATYLLSVHAHVATKIY